MLEAYGKYLWKEGRPCYHLSALLNAVAALKREVKPHLARAWDVAFTWQELEPGGTTPPIPRPVIQTLFTLCMLWGRPRVAVL